MKRANLISQAGLWVFTVILFSVVHVAESASTRAGQANQPLNVLLLLADDQSAHLQCLGTTGIYTPATTALAEAGVLFPNAFAASASCSPTRSSILTGMYPHSNGHWRNTRSPNIQDPQIDYSRQGKYADIEPVGVHEDIPTLIEILNEQGYETAITNKFHLSPVWKYPFRQRIAAGLAVDSNGQKAAEFFKSCGPKPFFLLANLTHTHRPFRSHIVETGYPEVNPQNIEVPANLPDTPELREDLSTYFETVQCADACAGAIIEALKKSGHYDNTLIIYTSDQGYCYQRAKATGYDLGVRVPMIIAGPAIRQRAVSQSLVSHIDLVPTILDFLSIGIPQTVQGVSLKKHLCSDTASLERKYVFAEHNAHGPLKEEFYPIRTVFDGRFHYLRNLAGDQKRWTGDLESLLESDSIPITLWFAGPVDAFQFKQWDNRAFEATIQAKDEFPVQYDLLKQTFARPKEELYDLHTDPFEMRNLADDSQYRAHLMQLRSVLEDWMKQTNDPEVQLMNIPRRTNR